jgi:hypothetical protein
MNDTEAQTCLLYRQKDCQSEGYLGGKTQTTCTQGTNRDDSRQDAGKHPGMERLASSGRTRLGIRLSTFPRRRVGTSTRKPGIGFPGIYTRFTHATQRKWSLLAHRNTCRSIGFHADKEIDVRQVSNSSGYLGRELSDHRRRNRMAAPTLGNRVMQ